MDADEKERALAALRRADYTGFAADLNWAESYQQSVAKAPALLVLLEHHLQVRVSVDDQIQDASYYMAYWWREPAAAGEQVIAVVRFSAWGELVTSFEPVEFGVHRPLAREALIAELAEAAGFTYIPYAVAQLRYDGDSAEQCDEPITWRERLFSYI